MKIKLFRSNLGNYFAFDGYGYTPKNILVNGFGLDALRSKTNPKWFIIDSEISRVEQLIQQVNVLDSYVLKNPSLESEKIPKSIPLSFVDHDIDGEFVFVEPYESLESLYMPEYRKEEESIKSIAFELIECGEYEITNPSNFSLRKIQSKEQTFVEVPDISRIASLDAFAEIITPEFAKHDCECFLTSKQVYQITRDFIKKNYDGKVSRISSDYDFCFCVEKFVETKPFLDTVFSYVRDKTIAKKLTKNEKRIPVFSMTWDGADKKGGYGDYPIIPKMEGKNLQDLQNKLTEFLEQLIKVINTKTRECGFCGGYGHTSEVWRNPL